MTGYSNEVGYTQYGRIQPGVKIDPWGIIVPDMRVLGQLSCLEVKQKNKKKSCRLYVYMYLHVVSSIHDVYLG